MHLLHNIHLQHVLTYSAGTYYVSISATVHCQQRLQCMPSVDVSGLCEAAKEGVGVVMWSQVHLAPCTEPGIELESFLARSNDKQYAKANADSSIL